MGRHSKPDKIKEEQGTLRMDRVNPDKPVVDPSLPELMLDNDLSEKGQEFFKVVSVMVNDMGISSRFDGLYLYMLSDKFSIWHKAKVKLSSMDLLDKNYKTIQVAEREAWRDVQNGLRLFGLTPIDRDKVSAIDAKVDNIENLLD